MQLEHKQPKQRYTYVTDQSAAPSNSKRELQPCLKCLSWEQKTQDLIWGYEELLSAKEKELQTMASMVDQLDEKLKKANLKIDNLNKKLQGHQNQVQRGKGNQEAIVSYYKEREEDLLAQLHAAQNELFAKNVLIKDEMDSKEDKALTDLLDQSKNKPKAVPKAQASLLPLLSSSSESLGKMLQRNLCDLQKMSQQKMMLQVKHRMAVLRAVQLSVLK